MASSPSRTWLSHLLPGMLFFAVAGVMAADNPVVPASNIPFFYTTELDEQLQALAAERGLTGDPAFPRDLRQITPDQDALVELGQILFFSQTLSGGYDTACATCHHPDFAMGDGLSLGIGVVPQNRAAVGPGRMVEPLRDLDPSADGGPNMFRNSLTTMNSSFLDRVMLMDGRVQVIESAIVPGGHGQAINTPESGLRIDADPVSGLLEFQAKGAMVTDNEMRGFLYTEYNTAAEYRSHLAQRLRGEVDSEYNTRPDAAANWLQLFRNGLDPSGSAEELITMANIQHAIGAYMDSQVFIESPWKHYLEGELNAISQAAKQGALLFLKTKEEGGLGCAVCHSGDRFTDEQFHNVGIPQLGRGFARAGTTDLGRWLETRNDEDRNAFRTLSLLNIALTGPWGHAGAFATLEDVIRYHADPRQAVDAYDFSLQSLPQFARTDITYPDAEGHTRDAISLPGFAAAEALLPARGLTVQEEAYLLAFFYSLTDSCAADPGCIGQWAPSVDQDPDGHLLVRDVSLAPPDLSRVSRTGAYPRALPLELPATKPLDSFTDVLACPNNLANAANTGRPVFLRRDTADIGLSDPQGYGRKTWFNSQSSIEATMMAGGVTAAYLDGDCWPDLAFTGGEVSGIRLYRNIGGTGFEDMSDTLTAIGEKDFSGIAVADLNGDYRRELIFGNITGQVIPVFAGDDEGNYTPAAMLSSGRPTYGISFAPLDASGHLYFYLAHWSGGSGQNGASPALWRTGEDNTLQPWDEEAGTAANEIDQSFNFTPVFADFTGDGNTDLAITSDFGTSATLRNIPDGTDSPHFLEETDHRVITDENGMGATLLDMDNDGVLEWFVTSIYVEDSNSDIIRETEYGDDFTALPINWGNTGNRLYHNASTTDDMAFEDITSSAGVRIGYWGWGACAADFNQDGFIDIYQVNGFGKVPGDILKENWQYSSASLLDRLTRQNFQDKPGLLYINQGNGTFADEAGQWALDVPAEGRGLSCFDYDRDGDIDIAVFNHSTGIQFFENQTGHGDGRHFTNIRLVGAAPNTDAIGAKVTVTADVGEQGRQTQLRLAQANSNYNSQNLPDLHFGLGEAAVIDELTVDWYGGESLTCRDVPVNRFLVIDQRDGKNGCP